jgi:hypothetical protein
MRSLNPRCLLATLQTVLAVSFCSSSSIAIGDASAVTPETMTGMTYARRCVEKDGFVGPP